LRRAVMAALSLVACVCVGGGGEKGRGLGDEDSRMEGDGMWMHARGWEALATV
jgi:hypothetical protein